MFSTRPGLILFSSDRGGNHATMFGPRAQKLNFRADECSFDDAGSRYTWAFEYREVLEPGFKFVFATADRTVIGEAKLGGAIEIAEETISVARGEGGKPERVIEPKGFVSPLRLIRRQGDKSTNSIRCLFVNPSIPYGVWGCYRAGVMNEGSFSSHGMAYVSATLKSAGHHCWLLDFRTCGNWDQVHKAISEQEYDVAFVGFLSIDAFNAAAAVRLLKEIHPDRPVVVGGLHVSIAKERVFPRDDLISYYCFDNYDIVPDTFKQFFKFKHEDRYYPERYTKADYVILDDGEIAARELVADLAAGRVPKERTIEGGAVPMEVARHLDRDLFNLDVEAYSPILPMQPTPMLTVTWARGCSYRCTYCNLSSQLSNTNVRVKPVELVEEELDDLHRRYGGRIGSLMIHDDLTFHIKHIAAWCELIIRKWGSIPIWMQTRASMINAWYHHRRDLWETLCRAGLTYVSVGFESGSNRVLEYMKKDCTVEENIECGRILDEYGINSFGNFLFGVPSETNEEAEATVDLVKKIKPGFLSGSIYCSYPGTAQDRECREQGLIVPGSVYTRSHLPWQYTIKGIDYAHRNDCVRRAGEYSNYLRMPKLLPEDRKRELAASSRGLPIH